MDNDINPGAAAARSGPGEYVTIAKVTKTQGRKGEVAAILLTDFPERFASRKRLLALDARDQRRALELEDHWFHKGQAVLKFVGIDSISDAETLIGCEIQVPGSERAALEAGAVYVSDLKGCSALDHGREFGTIMDVQFGSGEAPLLVIRGEKEYLVPFVAEYLEKIALEQKRIEMKLPEGMLELDAPLNREEREQQKKKSD
ncbi:MAG: ribosome maturation factor RimM [Acidobacteriia bacterium]|nr:ribosome maturation factor RimM [Terriglobia bacterium]